MIILLPLTNTAIKQIYASQVWVECNRGHVHTSKKKTQGLQEVTQYVIS